MSKRLKPIKFSIYANADVKIFNRSFDDKNETALHTMKIKPYYKVKNLYDFYSEYIQRSCNHDFDCCGCWFSSLHSAKRQGKNIIMKISMNRNY